MIMIEIYKGHEVIHDTMYDALHAHDCTAVQRIVSEYCFSLITCCPQLNGDGGK